jgi:hypothetical protein
MPKCSPVGPAAQCATDAPTSCKTAAPNPEMVPGPPARRGRRRVISSGVVRPGRRPRHPIQDPLPL